jgi:hypothetical protein
MKKAASTPLGWVGCSPPLLSLTATSGFWAGDMPPTLRHHGVVPKTAAGVVVPLRVSSSVFLSSEFASVSRTNKPRRVEAHWFAKRLRDSLYDLRLSVKKNVHARCLSVLTFVFAKPYSGTLARIVSAKCDFSM